MHCCAGDRDVVFAFDGDDGAPLTASFNEIYDAVLGVGTGINGTNALSSANYSNSVGYFSEVFKQLTGRVDVCGNPRLEFAFGAYFNGKNVANTNGDVGNTLFQILYALVPIEVPLNTYGTSPFNVCRIGLRHLGVYINGGILVGRPDILITNVFDVNSFPFRFIEARGQVSSQNEDGTTNPDAWIELRVDGVPVGNGDDFEVVRAMWLRGEPRDCTTLRESEIQTDPRVPPPAFQNEANAGSGWNAFHIAPMGDADCLYLKETAAFCNDVTPKPETDSKDCPDEPERTGGSVSRVAIRFPSVHPSVIESWPRDAKTGEPLIEGLAIVYGVERYLGLNPKNKQQTVFQRFEPFCCRETVANRRFRLLVDHEERDDFDVSQQNGRLECWETNTGLWFRARLPIGDITDRILIAAASGVSHRVCNGPGSGVSRIQKYGQHAWLDVTSTFDATEFSILLRGRACFPTWIAPATTHPAILGGDLQPIGGSKSTTTACSAAAT